MTINNSEITINNNPNVKCLDLILDEKLTFTAHASNQAFKENKMIPNISRILPNISAVKHKKRLFLSNAVHSLLLYGAPIWADRMSRQGWSALNRVQRRYTEEECIRLQTGR
jgi:hypothetical protein